MARNPPCRTGARLKRLIVRPLTRFGSSERGLVSLEWVALSAGVVVMAIIIGVTLMDGLEEPAAAIGDQLTVPAPPPPP